MKNMLSRKGFTLIELLVVIAIIGVLASIVLASLNSARRKSRDARRITDIKQIQLALELYYDAQSPPAYPDAIAIASGCDPATNKFNGLEDLIGSYIPQVPRDPNLTGTAACYRYSTPATSITRYHLGATLEETTNPAKDSDKDCNDTGAGCGFTAVAGTEFNGADAQGCTAEASKLCYDVVP